MLLAFLLSRTAAAEGLPIFVSQTLLQLRTDQLATRGDKPSTDVHIRIRQDLAIELTDELSLLGAIRLQPLSNPLPGEARVLKKLALYSEEAFAQWNKEWDGPFITIRAGKFSPNFARAWYLAPGVFGTDFVNDYQIVEQLGAQVSAGMKSAVFGTQAVSVSGTRGDRTFLTQSLFNNRGQVRLSSGGPSNTVAPTSIAAAYDGVRVPVMGGLLSYQIAYATLGRGRNDTGQERLAAIGANMTFPLEIPGLSDSGIVEVRPLAEVARRWDPDGHRSTTSTFATAGLEVLNNRWNADAVVTQRRIEGPGARTEYLAQGTLGYAIDQNFSLASAYRYGHVHGKESHSLAVQLSYSLARCNGCKVLASRHY